MVSVIIPFYNRSTLIGETLSCLSANKHKTSLEVIAVDDGSTDHGAYVVQEDYPWVRLLKQTNKGAPAARNLGLKYATGKYILFLDSDDLIAEDFFTKKILLLEKHDNIIGVYGPWKYFDSETRKILPRSSPYPIVEYPDSESHLDNLMGGRYIPCNALLWEKDVLLEIKGQREELVVNQDVDLNFRALLTGKILGTEAPDAMIRQHHGQRVGLADSTQKLRSILELRNFFYQRLKEKGLLTKEIRESLGRYLFNFWVSTRQDHPELANEFLALSQGIYPGLRLKGGKALQMLDMVMGPVNAIRIRSVLKSFRKE